MYQGDCRKCWHGRELYCSHEKAHGVITCKSGGRPIHCPIRKKLFSDIQVSGVVALVAFSAIAAIMGFFRD